MALRMIHALLWSYTAWYVVSLTAALANVANLAVFGPLVALVVAGVAVRRSAARVRVAT